MTIDCYKKQTKMVSPENKMKEASSPEKTNGNKGKRDRDDTSVDTMT